MPCRLQNDSPPNSINQPHLNKENELQKLSNTINENSQQRINENNNLIKSTKFPENVIDESNYVNLNEITTKCKVIPTDFSRNAQRPKENSVNGVEKTNQNHINVIDNKNNLVNNFYLQINSASTITNAYNTSKPIISMVNQKNLNNMAKNGQNTINSNGNANNLMINGFTTNTNGLNNNFNASNNNNINSNMNINGNGVLNDASIDTKSITTNGIDYNKNGLPAVSTSHINDVTNGHQMQCTNKSGICNNNITPQTYVIHNGNGLTNGNNGTKEMPRIDSNKGKYALQDVLFLLFFFVHLTRCTKFCVNCMKCN